MVSLVASVASMKLGCDFYQPDQFGVAVKLNGFLPRRLFTPANAELSRLYLRTIYRANENRIICTLSDGHNICLDAMSSWLAMNQVRCDAERKPRDATVLISLVAWGLNAVWESVLMRRSPGHAASLRASFNSFQRQAVLQVVTPLSLYQLARDVARRDRIHAVRWVPKTAIFVVD